MSQSQRMRDALSKYVIPNLITAGFSGKHPHYKKVYCDRIELLSFQTNKWGNSFAVEVSTVFLPHTNRDSNFSSKDDADYDNATVWNTNIRYRLKGMYNGWFYYTDVYRYKVLFSTYYNAVSETRAKNYIPQKREKLVQKATDDIYRKVCEEVNSQMLKAFIWWDAFNRNNRIKMKNP